MSLLTPAMLGLGILIPILILLYLLKVRRLEYPVSSTLLWQDLLRDLAAHEPWQRLHWSVLLVTQILIVGLVVLALARPFFVVQAQEAVHAVLVLDASASMQATDVEPSRFEVARRAARQTLRDLGEGSVATIVLAKSQPEVLAPATDDRQSLERAIDAAEVSFGPADIQQALVLATTLGPERGRLRVYLFTDGAFGELKGFDAEGIDIRLVSVGVDGENQAITGLAARPDPQNARRFQLFTRVRNYGDQPARTTFSLQVDGQLSESRQIDLPPGEAQEFMFSDLPLGAKAVEAHLAGSDHFPLDNAAYAVLDVRRSSEILLVSQGNLFLEKVLGLLPNSEVFRVAPRRYFSIDADRYDVVVFDGFLPDSMPRGSALVINPPESSLFTIDGELRRPRIRHWERDDPVLQFVDLRDVAIARAQRITPPGWARTLIESDDAPLLLAGEHDGQRTVIMPFDIRQSNLPLSAAFPIMMANILGYLEPGGQAAQRDLHPGDAITIAPLPQAEDLVIRRPSGPPKTIHVEGQPITFADTGEPGLYGVSQRAAGQTILEELFAVNASDEQESDIRPRTVLLGNGRPLQAGTQADLVPVNREIWLWLAPLALGLLLFEWFWFHRRS
ncbi:MAG TPA: VWA domain-containing protein [Chloroflexota bacterium]|nr:VWA domain-containing protein [Chloroflexota bacterium]